MKDTAESISREEYDWLEYEATDLYESVEYDGVAIFGTDGVHRKLISDLSIIEEFVEKVIASDAHAFSWKADKYKNSIPDGHRLAKYLNSFEWIYERLSKEYIYSTKVNLFIQCYLEFRYQTYKFTTPNHYDVATQKFSHEIFNEFIALIRIKSGEKEFRDNEKQQKHKVKRRLQSAHGYIDKLFRNRNKLTVIRIDFSYRKSPSYEVTPEIAKKDLKRFLNNKRGNRSLFEHYEGYIWKLEYGPDKGYHYHMVLFFNGDKIQSDSHWAMKIGEYWKTTITKGRGIYFNCNAEKVKYTYLGIGKIPRSDERLVGYLKKYVIGYLAKTEQYLKAKVFGNERCFDMGGGNRKQSNAGRPVKKAACPN